MKGGNRAAKLFPDNIRFNIAISGFRPVRGYAKGDDRPLLRRFGACCHHLNKSIIIRDMMIRRHHQYQSISLIAAGMKRGGKDRGRRILALWLKNNSTFNI